MTLAEAKRLLKRSVMLPLSVDPDNKADAVAVVVKSWGAKTTNGKTRRKKGHAYECTVANYLKAIYPDAKRGLQSRDGAEAADVEGTPLFIECKRRHKLTGLLTLYAKAVADAAKDPACRPAVVIAKEDHGPEVALIPLELLIGLLACIDDEIGNHGGPMHYHAERGRGIMEATK